jgi:hypothetical protein
MISGHQSALVKGMDGLRTPLVAPLCIAVALIGIVAAILLWRSSPVIKANALSPGLSSTDAAEITYIAQRDCVEYAHGTVLDRLQTGFHYLMTRPPTIVLDIETGENGTVDVLVSVDGLGVYGECEVSRGTQGWELSRILDPVITNARARHP